MQQIEILSPSPSATARRYAAAPQLDRFLTLDEVLSLTSMSQSTLHREIVASRFPAPIPISRQRKAWSLAEVAAWQRDKRAAPRRAEESAA